MQTSKHINWYWRVVIIKLVFFQSQECQRSANKNGPSIHGDIYPTILLLPTYLHQEICTITGQKKNIKNSFKYKAGQRLGFFLRYFYSKR